MRVELTLEWRLSWTQPGGSYRELIFTDIEDMKKNRTALRAMQAVGQISKLSTVERYAAIPATQWRKPMWVK